ncbi:MAG: polysaccharide deacetylase family protein [Bacilli bacterium]
MKKIILIISILFITGCTQIKMLDLSNKSLKDIEKYAEIHKIKLEVAYQYNDSILKDKVISQNISKNTKIKKNSNLKIVISLGKNLEQLYKENNVNEIGRIPVMMYHGIEDKINTFIGGNIDKEGYQRTKSAFINDLEFYYKEGYRMIRLNDYVNDKIDVSLGKSPIVLTFDDGLVNNIKVTGLDTNGNIIIDPNCAIGILEQFKKKYPDYNVTATFFLNGWLFRQEKYNEKILNYLIDNGYDIGNHSYNHVNFKNISSIKSEEEIARVYELLEKYIPNKYVNIVALPFGSPNKKNHDNFSHIIMANYNNKTYHTISTLQVGWESDYSPFSSNFDKIFIKRIRAYDNNGTNFDIKYSFDKIKYTKYISDGDVNTIVIPKENKIYLKDNNTLKVVTY